MSTLAGCEKPVNVGSSASTIEVDRGAYFAQKNNVKAQDISNVIEFIDSIEKIAGDIGAYTTSYDPDTSTVYATTDDGNIAFYLDDQGYVMFASANGTLETKNEAQSSDCRGHYRERVQEWHQRRFQYARAEEVAQRNQRERGRC